MKLGDEMSEVSENNRFQHFPYDGVLFMAPGFDLVEPWFKLAFVLFVANIDALFATYRVEGTIFPQSTRRT